MQKTCKQCGQPFEVTQDDLSFYEMVSPEFGGTTYLIPPPTLCPDCRHQRRLAFRNERSLYHRKCDLTGKQLVSVFSPDKPTKVYAQAEWWSDRFDPLAYGRDFDFSKPFFEQFDRLLKDVPQMNLSGANNENSDYCNLTANCRNCYLVFEGSNNEDCLYGYWLQKCADCCNVSFSHECRFCYELDNCYNCHRLLWAQNCTNCSDSAYLFDCIGCRNCLFSVNMRQKEYCIFNRCVGKEEFDRQRQELEWGSAKAVQAALERFREFLLGFPQRSAQFVNAENCTGDYIQNCRNCIECYHAHEAEDCKFGEHVWRNSKNNMDVSTVGRDAECVYEATNTAIGVAFMRFTNQCWSGCSNLLYCSNCGSSQDSFGCVGLKHKKYCILNKQYTKEEYEDLVPKIIEYMRQTREWGEYFPAPISMFGYNETSAHEQMPLTKEEVLKKGWKWHDEDEQAQHYLGPPVKLPDHIRDASDEICQKILTCTATGRPYKIIPQELKFYRDLGIPLPQLSPDERHRQRMARRNPRKLWHRQCAKCQKPITTSYSPERPEIVYCEECYLREVY